MAPYLPLARPYRNLSRLLAGGVVAIVGVGLAVRIAPIREAVRAPITMTLVSLFVRPWQSRAVWTAGAPLPTTMLEPAAAVVDGKLYVFGGFVTTARSHEFLAVTRVAVYDPVVDAWSRAADMPQAVTHANAVVVDREVWSAGGFVGDDPGHAVAAVRCYDAATDRWRDGPALPQAVAGGTLALVGRTLHYVGGFAPDRDTVLTTHFTLALDDAAPRRWEARAPLPTGRGHLASAVVGERLYAIGGQVRHDTDPLDLALVDVYDPTTDGWTPLASLPTPRSHFEAATFVRDGRIVVVGGRNNTTSLLIKGAGLADVLVYDPRTDRWTRRPGLPIGVASPVAQPIGDRLIVTAGATFGDVVPQRQTFTGALP